MVRVIARYSGATAKALPVAGWLAVPIGAAIREAPNAVTHLGTTTQGHAAMSAVNPATMSVVETTGVPGRSAVHVGTTAARIAGAGVESRASVIALVAVMGVAAAVEIGVAVTIAGFLGIREAVTAQFANPLGPGWSGGPMSHSWKKAWICASCRFRFVPSCAG